MYWELPAAHLCVVPCVGKSKVGVNLETLGVQSRNPTGGTDFFLAVFTAQLVRNDAKSCKLWSAARRSVR